MAWRSCGRPGMGGYWLWPACMAAVTASTSLGSQPKSGKPWPRFTAWCSAASADMVVKMVVPTWGRRLGKAGVRGVAEVMAEAAENGNGPALRARWGGGSEFVDRESTRLDSSHLVMSYAVFSL